MLAPRLCSPDIALRCVDSTIAGALQQVFRIQRCRFTNCTALRKQERPQRRPLSKASEFMIKGLENTTGPENRRLVQRHEQEAARLWENLSAAKEQITPDSVRESDAARLEAEMLRIRAKETHRVAKKAYIDYRVSLYRRRLVTSTDPDVVGKNLDRARNLSRASWDCIRADWATLLPTLLAPLDELKVFARLAKMISVLGSTLRYGNEIVMLRALIIFGSPMTCVPKDRDKKRP